MPGSHIHHKSFGSFIAAMDQIKHDIQTGDIIEKYNLVQLNATNLSSKQTHRRSKLNHWNCLPEMMPNDRRYQGLRYSDSW